MVGKKWLLALVLVLAVPLSMAAQYVPQGSPNYNYHWYGTGESCEYLFVGAFRSFIPSPRKGTEMLLDKSGDLVWYHQGTDFTLDFKVHPNGRMTYNDRHFWFVLDSTFAVVDTVMCDSRITDFHDLILTDDGHYYMICRDDSTIDLSDIRTDGGTPGSQQGQVRMVVLQELGADEQMLREWNGFDHYTIYDSDTTYFTNPNLLDATHTNSIDLDGNGNLLVSHRHLDEVTLIDWQSGQIRWQMSGKNNDFDLQGDPGFYGQHDARFLPGGSISVYDNGLQYGRGLIMALDTVQWTAYPSLSISDSIVSRSMGSFRYFPDGSALIDHGEISSLTDAGVAYYGADGNKVFDIRFATDYHTYRAQCLDLPFDLHRPRITCTQGVGEVMLGVDGVHAQYEWTHGDTLPVVTVSDTGRYQVFVPQGIGMISSAPVYITNLQNGCAALGVAPGVVSPPRPPRLIGRYDLLGNPVLEPRAFQVLLERYSDGSVRKVVRTGE